MITSFRERLTLGFLALLPFHALFVTVAPHLFGIGGGVFLWKEIILGLMLSLALLEVLQQKEWRSPDVFDGLLLSILFYSIVISFSLDVPLKQFVFGFKYDVVPLVSFIILRRVPWSPSFLKNIQTILLIDAVFLCVYGIATLFLPDLFFAFLGYSDLHSLYIPDGALAPFQYLEASSLRRMQSAMSGPNQLGIWLLLPLSILMSQWKDWRVASGIWQFALGFLLCIGILLTFSRSAWIAACVLLVIGLCSRTSFKLSSIALHLLKIALPILLCIALIVPFIPRSILLRANSSLHHVRKPMQAVSLMIQHPFGLGLGSAGPASNAVSDACVFLSKDADALWAKAHSNLCVFKGDTQVQPLDHTCSCPVLTENWYLQWGVEMGFFGLIVSLFIPLLLIHQHWHDAQKRWILFAYIGVSIAGLFLHSFEDSAVAYTVWMLLSLL